MEAIEAEQDYKNVKSLTYSKNGYKLFFYSATFCCLNKPQTQKHPKGDQILCCDVFDHKLFTFRLTRKC